MFKQISKLFWKNCTKNYSIICEPNVLISSILKTMMEYKLYWLLTQQSIRVNTMTQIWQHSIDDLLNVDMLLRTYWFDFRLFLFFCYSWQFCAELLENISRKDGSVKWDASQVDMTDFATGWPEKDEGLVEFVRRFLVKIGVPVRQPST